MNSRRKLVIALGAGALAAPLGSFAQQQGKVWRVGFFYIGTRQSAMDTGRYGAFIEGMRQLGYVEDKNLVLKERFASDGDYARLPEIATELVHSNVDVILVTGGPATHALKQAASTVPIIVTIATDPVREGLAASMAHPGGNFTGFSAFLDSLFPKHIEFLKIAVAKLSRVAVLSKAGNPNHPRLLKLVEDAAQTHAIQVLPAAVNDVRDIEQGFSLMAKQRAQAVIILGDSFFVQHFRGIAGFAVKHRLASIYSGREYPDAGGLMSYGPSFADNFRRAAIYVDKILKGAKPGDLPFEQPTRLYLTINSKTGKAIGLTIPSELLLRADNVIE
jgi:putative ABC transport system substrate-binding protein